MELLTNLIRLGQPGGDFRIDVIDALEPEGMQVILRREGFDPPEAGIFQATRKHDMAVNPFLSNDERGKTHPDLKRNSGFLWENGDWPVSTGDTQELVENGANDRRLSLEMRR